MKHLWSLICQNAITNQETNNVTLVEVLEELKFALNSDPGLRETVTKALNDGNLVIPVNLSLVTTWLRSELEVPETSQAHMEIKSPAGVILLQQDYPVNLSDHSRLRARNVIVNFPFKGNGAYQFVVYHRVGNGWQEDISIPLTVSEESSLSSSASS